MISALRLTDGEKDRGSLENVGNVAFRARTDVDVTLNISRLAENNWG